MSRSATDVWLIVEDNDDDFFLFRRACGEAFGSQLTLHRALDGFAALQFLSARTEPLRLIVCDFSMPRMNGLEFLKWVRSQEAFRHTRLVMLSNSGQQRGIEDAVSSRADDYQEKPLEFERLVTLVKRLGAGAT
jgi:CheY-like chemotaxis protein